MYHRFEENRYPSTNIKINDFKNQINLIKKNDFTFVNPNMFEEELKNKNIKRKVLLTIDDGFLSFYENAWPILKNNKIPFILFVSTKEVGNSNYMNWDQIQEVHSYDFAHIGNHSHSHGYLIDKNKEEIEKDLIKSIKILKEKLNHESEFFSYPFGEYSIEFKKIVKNLNFKYAFGQHSGVLDETKDLLEMPRFPINEKYGKIERFKTLLKTLPFKYVKILPEERYITNASNPPKISIEFFKDLKNYKMINCYSNEENLWRKSEVQFYENNKIEIILKGKFTTERGRVNCSLQEKNNFWRWLGIQFVVAEM
tara:strand:- start:122 stop:1054 length:933 start_codon:yes stop_codon:yes gene_type:complete